MSVMNYLLSHVVFPLNFLLQIYGGDGTDPEAMEVDWAVKDDGKDSPGQTPVVVRSDGHYERDSSGDSKVA